MPRYEAYILRTWCSTGVDGVHWSLRLEHLPHGDRCQFKDPDELAAYLHAREQGSAAPEADNERTERPAAE